jgi:hypothetical protein
VRDHLAGCFGTPCCCCGCCCGCCCMPWPIGSTNPPMCIGCPCGPHICRADARSVVRTHARASAARRHTVLARRAEKKRPGLDTGTLCPVTRALPQHFCRLWPRPRVLCPGCAAALLPSWAATPGIVPGLCRSTAAVLGRGPGYCARALPQHCRRLGPRPRVLCPGFAAALLPSALHPVPGFKNPLGAPRIDAVRAQRLPSHPRRRGGPRTGAAERDSGSHVRSGRHGLGHGALGLPRPVRCDHSRKAGAATAANSKREGAPHAALQSGVAACISKRCRPC